MNKNEMNFRWIDMKIPHWNSIESIFFFFKLFTLFLKNSCFSGTLLRLWQVHRCPLRFLLQNLIQLHFAFVLTFRLLLKILHHLPHLLPSFLSLNLKTLNKNKKHLINCILINKSNLVWLLPVLVFLFFLS